MLDREDDEKFNLARFRFHGGFPQQNRLFGSGS